MKKKRRRKIFSKIKHQKNGKRGAKKFIVYLWKLKYENYRKFPSQ